MPMSASEIERRIKAAIPDAVVELRDLAGDDNHWAATVISEQFRGKSRVDQQRMVNAALSNLMRALADHWGRRGVTVHLIAPGPVESPRMRAIAERAAERRGGGTTFDEVLDEYRAGSPLGRLTTIEEVVWAVGILFAPEAAALHGATLSLDLGRRRGIG